jgi:hypothetical protein
MHDKITAFVDKISIWKLKVANRNIDMFPRTSDFIKDNEFGLTVIKNVILSSNHLGNSVREIFSNRLEYRKTRLHKAAFHHGM